MKQPGECRAYLMRKSSLVSLVPFISSRIQTGGTPRPVHFKDLFFLDRYFGFRFARLAFPPRLTFATLTAVEVFFEMYPPSWASWLCRCARCSLTFFARRFWRPSMWLRSWPMSIFAMDLLSEPLFFDPGGRPRR